MSDIDVYRIIRLQAMWRGFMSRRRFKAFQRELIAGIGNYFSREEYMETIASGEKYNPELPLRYSNIKYKSTEATYSGNMRSGFRDGRGTMKWADGASYEGDWKAGCATGTGTFFHVNGDKYHGSYVNNKCNGYGVYTSAKGSTYKGDWVDDKQQGQGQEYWPYDASNYVGQFFDGKK